MSGSSRREIRRWRLVGSKVSCLVVPGLVLLASACTRPLADLVRSRAEEDLHCPGSEIEVERRAAGGMRASGCGLTETYVCVRSTCTREAGDVVVTDAPERSDESVMRAVDAARSGLSSCFSTDELTIRLTIDTQGRVPYAAPALRASPETQRCVAAAFVDVDIGEPAAAPRTVVVVPWDWRPADPGHRDPSIELPSVESTDAALDSTAEAAARAALDGRRDAILACAGVATVALDVDVAADGHLAIALRGALAGSAEERCVQATVGDLAIATPPAPGALIHVVTAP